MAAMAAMAKGAGRMREFLWQEWSATRATARGMQVGARRSFDPAGLVETQPRRAREDAGRIAAAEVDQEVGTPVRAGEERRIDHGVVEARHRPAIQPQRARREQEISALQAAVAQA